MGGPPIGREGGRSPGKVEDREVMDRVGQSSEDVANCDQRMMDWNTGRDEKGGLQRNGNYCTVLRAVCPDFSDWGNFSLYCLPGT